MPEEGDGPVPASRQRRRHCREEGCLGGGCAGERRRRGAHSRDEVRRVVGGLGRADAGGGRPHPQLPRGAPGRRALGDGEDHQQTAHGILLHHYA